MTTNVKEYELKSVQISELEFDHSNPNQLTKKQKAALQNVMKKYGFLVPIIIDSEKHIIDGEHRAEAYAQLGYSVIPAFIIDTTPEDYDKKFLRQWLNKFHGSPDLEKDIEELESIMQDETGAAMLDELLGIDADILKDMNEGLEEESGGTGEDKDDQADKMRKVILYFTKIEYPEIKEKFDRLKEDYQVTTETEVVKALLEHRESSL
jgi:hypothetical protein